MTPPQPENAAKAPTRNQSAPSGTNRKPPETESKPKKPTAAAHQLAGPAKARHRAVRTRNTPDTMTQFRISSVCSIRLPPNSSTSTHTPNAARATRYTAPLSSGRAARPAARKKKAPAEAPAQAGQPFWRK